MKLTAWSAALSAGTASTALLPVRAEDATVAVQIVDALRAPGRPPCYRATTPGIVVTGSFQARRRGNHQSPFAPGTMPPVIVRFSDAGTPLADASPL
jgi:hypothetical protein